MMKRFQDMYSMAIGINELLADRFDCRCVQNVQ